MADNELVLGIFADEATADAAVELLKTWESISDDIKLGPIGVLVADENGQLKEHKMGQRSGGKGASIGLVLAVVAPPTLLAGIVGGGILGHFHHKGLGLTPEDRERIGSELAGGKAAVGLLVPAGEAAAVSAKLTALGGAPEVHAVSDEALAAVAEAAPAEPTAPEAVAATEAAAATDTPPTGA